jgi:hypothetical protein
MSTWISFTCAHFVSRVYAKTSSGCIMCSTYWYRKLFLSCILRCLANEMCFSSHCEECVQQTQAPSLPVARRAIFEAEVLSIADIFEFLVKLFGQDGTFAVQSCLALLSDGERNTTHLAFKGTGRCCRSRPSGSTNHCILFAPRHSVFVALRASVSGFRRRRNRTFFQTRMCDGRAIAGVTRV